MENINKVSLEKVKLIEFNLSTRLKNIFKDNDIVYFSQLLKMSMSELIDLNRMGQKSINELMQFIQVFIFWDEKLNDICRYFDKGVAEDSNEIQIKKENIKKMLIQSCDLSVSNEEIVKRIKYNLNKDFGTKIRDSYLKSFVETEKRRILQRNNFGIRQEWIFEIDKI